MVKIAALKSIFTTKNSLKCFCSWGSAPDPLGELPKTHIQLRKKTPLHTHIPHLSSQHLWRLDARRFDPLSRCSLLKFGAYGYGVSLAIWYHTVLPAPNRWPHPALILAGQAGIRFTYPRGWKAELTWVTGYILIWFTHPWTVTHPSTNLAVHSCTAQNSQPGGWTRNLLITHPVPYCYTTMQSFITT